MNPILTKLKNNPAVILGLIGAAVVAATQYHAGGWASVDWTAIVPAVMGVITRFTVYGPVTQAAAVDAAVAQASVVNPKIQPILAAIQMAADDAASKATQAAITAMTPAV